MINNKNLYIKVSLFAILIILVSLINRYAVNDEGWLGEHAFFLGSEGIVKSEMFSGFRNSNIQIFNYHKLHVWLGGLLTYLFGLNIYLLKSISLISLIVLCRYLYKFYKGQRQLGIVTLAFSFLLINNHIVTHSFIYRPELLSTTLGFISFYHLTKLNRNRFYLSPILAGLSALAHLNGLIFIITGGIYLLIQKEWRKSIIFMVISSLSFSMYFIDIMIPKNNLDLFLMQFESLEPKISILQKVISEHFRIFHSPKEIILFILLIFTSIIPLFRKRIKINNSIKYTLILSSVFVLVSPNKTDKYLVFLIPFIIILITTSLNYLYPFYKSYQRKLINISLILYGLINVVSSIQLITKNGKFVSEQNSIVDRILEDSNSADPKVGCDLLFMYNKGITDLNLKGITYYQYKYRDINKVYSYKWDLIFSDMYNDNRKYIVFSKKTMQSHKYTADLYKKIYDYFFETDSYIILKRL